MVAGLCVALALTAANAAEFLTRDPLKAFVHGEYPLGDDYFIRGTEDTVVFRCLLPGAGPHTTGHQVFPAKMIPS